MAEILVRVNPGLNHSYSNNDVIVVMVDGHEWGKGELDKSVFRVVSIPGTVEELKYLMDEDKEVLNNVLPKNIYSNPKTLTTFIQKNTINRPTKNSRRYQIANNQIIDKRL